MSHMIMEDDMGVVGFVEKYGGTWHGLDQYEERDGPVPVSKVKQTFGFDLEKEPLYHRKDVEGFGSFEEVDGWCITRKDTEKVVVPMVGSRFHVMSHGEMFRHVEQGLLVQYPELEIESVGTLENGATAFVNLYLGKLNIHGDQSDNISRMMFYNPLGKGAYALGVHTVRIVCNNTLRMAEAESTANATLHKIRHTQSAGAKINAALVDLAQVKLGLQSFEDRMTEFTVQAMNSQKVDEFLNEFIPVTDDLGQAGQTRRKNQQESIRANFEEAEGLDVSVSRSKYAMVQAVTKYLDHPEKLSKNQDMASVAWDGLVGRIAVRKDKAVSILAAV